MFKNVRIGVKLIIVGTLIMVVPIAVIAFLAVGRSTSGLAALETENLARGARLVAATIDGVFQEEKKLAVAGARDQSIVAAAIGAATRTAGNGTAGNPPDAFRVATGKLQDLKSTKGLGEARGDRHPGKP
jgi:hypothetical protein